MTLRPPRSRDRLYDPSSARFGLNPLWEESFLFSVFHMESVLYIRHTHLTQSHVSKETFVAAVLNCGRSERAALKVNPGKVSYLADRYMKFTVS